MRTIFFAGMSTTQRSESINSFFDKYVKKKTSLKEFVEQYKVALEDRKQKEIHADFNTWHKEPVLKSPSPFEKQMSSLYTHEVFKKFQAEVLGAAACFSSKEKESDIIKIFKVQDFERKINFMVDWDERTQDITCLCHMFEYNGFICRHAICVLQSLGIFYVPKHYILKRWTKDAKTFYSSPSQIIEEAESKKQRLDRLYSEAMKLIEEGSLSQKSFDIAYHALKEALKKCVIENHSVSDSANGLQGLDKENIDGNLLHSVTLLDPKVSSTKGAPKRMKSGVEKSNNKKVDNKSRKVHICLLS